MELIYEVAELDDIRAVGDMVGAVLRQMWRDEFAPAGQWRTFTGSVLLEADRLRGVLDDLTAVVGDARIRVVDVEARAGWVDEEGPG